MATYLRLRSLRTGHQWDASAIAARAYLATGGVQIVTRYPPRRAAHPRPAKPLRDLAGKPASPHHRRPPGTTSKEQ
ncbi:MAG TPA: hypothetical protein VF062_28215 [Candidatus Limnocylindrales bacterium]